MSVLIKGMEMPTSCWECHFGHGDTGICVVDFKSHGDWNEPQDCPLVEIPPHGRLGDLDELAKVVLNWITTQEKAYPNEDSNALSWRLGARAMGHQIYRDIEAVPTIIPASEEVYDKYTDTAGNLHWTGTHSGKHIVKAEEATP